MKYSALILLLCCVVIGCKEETPPQYTGSWDSRPLAATSSASWRIGRVDSTMYDIALDSAIVHSGNSSGHIFSVSDSPSYGGYIAADLDPELVKTKRVELTTWYKSENTAGIGTIFVRMAREPKGETNKGVAKKIFEGISEFAGVEELPEWMLLNDTKSVQGTTEWTRHSFTFDVPIETTNIWFGAILSGTGKIWIDDFSYKIVGELSRDSAYKDMSSYIARPKYLDFEYTE
jgi:hypothetical protein